MLERARLALWWPGFQDDIARRHARCKGCDVKAPSQPAALPTDLPRLDYPMQSICSDVAFMGGKTYIIIVDRYSNWPSIHMAGKASNLVKVLRQHFVTFGVPETLSSDGGPEYTAAETE